MVYGVYLSIQCWCGVELMALSQTPARETSQVNATFGQFVS